MQNVATPFHATPTKQPWLRFHCRFIVGPPETDLSEEVGGLAGAGRRGWSGDHGVVRTARAALGAVLGAAMQTLSGQERRKDGSKGRFSGELRGGTFG